MNFEINKNIKKLIEKIGITPYEFSKQIGNKRPDNLYNILNEKVEVSATTLNKIFKKYPDYKEFILTGENQTPKEDVNTQVPSKTNYIDNIPTVNSLINIKGEGKNLVVNEFGKGILDKALIALTNEEKEKIAHLLKIDFDDLTIHIDRLHDNQGGKLVPVYNTSAAAGNTEIEMSGNRTSMINVGDLLKDSEGAIYVYGNSMIPGYPPGCLIGVRIHNDSFIEPGTVYVIETKVNRYVKRVYYSKDKKSLLCLSDNHIKHDSGALEGELFYPPFEIPLEEIKQIFVVTGVIKRNSSIMM